MKKTILNIKWILPVILIAMTVSSCLKDNDWEDGLYGAVRDTEGQQFVSIPKATKTTGIVMALEAKSTVQNLNMFEVNYDFVSPAVSDITVTIVVDNSNVKKINPASTILPTAAYTIPTLTMVIPKGSNLSEAFKFNFLSTPLDPTQVYGIGFTIASISPAGISIPANLKNVNYFFTVKNKYDGVYVVNGTMVDAAAPTITGYLPMNYHLITTGTSSVDGFDPDVWEDYFVPIYSGTSVSGYGSFSPQFVFDASNKITAVTNAYGQPAGNGRSAELDPSGVNSWDPATKTIKVKFWMNQPSVIAGHRTAFDWTMVYKGVRP